MFEKKITYTLEILRQNINIAIFNVCMHAYAHKYRHTQIYLVM